MREPIDRLTAIRDPARLEALAQTGLMESRNTEAFDRLARLAQRVLDADLSFISIIGADRQRVAGSSVPDLEMEGLVEKSYCQFVVGSGEPVIVDDAREHEGIVASGALAEHGIMEYAGIPLRSPDGHVIGSFCAAATRPRKWTERDIEILNDLAAAATTEIELRVDNAIRRRLTTELEEAYRLAEAASTAKSDFLASMSHELRTPLNSVIGFTNMLLKNRDGRLQQQELLYLDRVRANGMHLLALINEVLDLAKVEAGRLELHLAEVDLRELVSSTAEELEGKQHGGVALRLEVPPVRAITTDPLRLKQVLINLAGNALKFTEQGFVTIRIIATPRGVPVAVEVADTGIGIPPDRIRSVFEPFTQAGPDTHERYGGTGLGLAISRALCEMMGFRLAVESEPGVGSTFRILLKNGAD
jgi:signal transduction histidine kinase